MLVSHPNARAEKEKLRKQKEEEEAREREAKNLVLHKCVQSPASRMGIF